MSWEVAHISELELPKDPDHQERPAWATVRLHFEIQSFGVNAWTAAKPGELVISEHDELGNDENPHEELYVVANGRAQFTVAGDEIDAPVGTFVFVREPSAKRKAVALEPDTTVLAVGGPPGAVFVPSAWELSGPALAFWSTGEFDKAIEALEATLAEHGEHAGTLYNLACAESRAGRTEDAIAHLNKAIDLDARFAELAEKDEDFDPVREEPEFASAVARKVKAGGSSS